MKMENMKITNLRARAVNVPLAYPVRTSIGIVATAPLVLIDIETDAGQTGRAYVFTYTPLVLKPVRELLMVLRDVLVGQPAAPFEIERMLAARFRLLGNTGIVKMACAGIDMALWDALAKSRALPLVELLGGQRKAIDAYDSHSMDGEKIGLARALDAVEQGFRAIKIKIGYRTLAEDLHIVRTIRAAIGDSVELMVDFNQSLSVPEAIRRGRALDGEGLAWIEEPTRQEDYAGHAQIRAAISTPVQLGENWFGVEEMHKAISAGAAGLVMPDAMKIGGVSGWLRASTLAEAHSLPMSSHIFQEISCHLLAVTPTAHWLERMDLAGPILAHPLEFSQGKAMVPERPGIGIDWNEEAVQKYAV
jgi:mandelate racemase